MVAVLLLGHFTYLLSDSLSLFACVIPAWRLDKLTEGFSHGTLTKSPTSQFHPHTDTRYVSL